MRAKGVKHVAMEQPGSREPPHEAAQRWLTQAGRRLKVGNPDSDLVGLQHSLQYALSAAAGQQRHQPLHPR